ncbi:signal transduction histidine kinase [Microbacterium endophyticum]|uniref:histidine kinase n=1 Tax=Microbacterium endophyticum TaxID=1526412 RepID=A0A7W4YKW6_9MICO|nr:HAMP domain-containing sensor histidine kinase [Microbacterium endophyticum]MBB2974845.1 signal transduction histidine kinase [Microbacterium endophyticum]NIK37142.1 signal transduction histidine kinase [Microbacterium endophyticum]
MFTVRNPLAGRATVLGPVLAAAGIGLAVTGISVFALQRARILAALPRNASRADIDAALDPVLTSSLTYAAAGIIVLGAIAAAGWYVSRRVYSPLRNLEETAAQVTLADLGARLPDRGKDDFSSLNRTINEMFERLEGSVDVQRQLLDDIRHELKTPLTIVRGHLEIMNTTDPLDVASAREVAMSELDRMSRLIDDIDLLATVEGGGQLSMDVVDLRALTQSVAQRAAVIPGHAWRVESRARGHVHGDFDRLLQAWLQLADNAAKYTPSGSPIEIGSAVDDVRASLWIRDHGSGIPPAARHRVFRRFDRANGQRSVGGSGLGLAIVDAIAKAHGGTCAITDTAGGGATFTIEIPLHDYQPAAPAPVRAEDVVTQREATG